MQARSREDRPGFTGRKPIMRTRRTRPISRPAEPRDIAPLRRTAYYYFVAHLRFPLFCPASSRDEISHPQDNSVRFLNVDVAAIGPRACVCTIPGCLCVYRYLLFPSCAVDHSLQRGTWDMCTWVGDRALRSGISDPTKSQRAGARRFPSFPASQRGGRVDRTCRLDTAVLDREGEVHEHGARFSLVDPGSRAGWFCARCQTTDRLGLFTDGREESNQRAGWVHLVRDRLSWATWVQLSPNEKQWGAIKGWLSITSSSGCELFVSSDRNQGRREGGKEELSWDQLGYTNGTSGRD